MPFKMNDPNSFTYTKTLDHDKVYIFVVTMNMSLLCLNVSKSYLMDYTCANYLRDPRNG